VTNGWSLAPHQKRRYLRTEAIDPSQTKSMKTAGFGGYRTLYRLAKLGSADTIPATAIELNEHGASMDPYGASGPLLDKGSFIRNDAPP